MPKIAENRCKNTQRLIIIINNSICIKYRHVQLYIIKTVKKQRTLYAKSISMESLCRR